MSRLRVGVMNNTINSRYGPKPAVQADYLTAIACGADSFWVADHLQSVLPPSMWTPKHVGASRVIPKMDAHLDPWTILGYLAGHNRIGRMSLGTAVTDTGRRNPAVTAQAVASLHLLTRGKAVLGIGTGERESNAPYGVDWSKPVARFEEAVATIRALWDSNGELVSRDSPFFPLRNATFALPPYKGKWPEIWVAAHGPRMMRATGRYADGWFPGTTRAAEYGEQLDLVRTAASDAGRDPMDITPALIRFIVTGRSRDEIDEVVESDIAKIFTLNCDGKAWARHGAEHPLGSDFAGSQDLIPQLSTNRPHSVTRPKSPARWWKSCSPWDSRRGHRTDRAVPRPRHASRRGGKCRCHPTESAQERGDHRAIHQGGTRFKEAVMPRCR